MRRLVACVGLSATIAATGLLGLPAASWAADGAIDNVSSDDKTVHVVFSLPGLAAGTTPDLDTLEVTVNGNTEPATAQAASDVSALQRVSILTIDTSKSMAGEPFRAARAAALSFIDQSPADVEIGLVSFAGKASVVESPTTDRGALREAVGELSLTASTHLYDGIGLALETLGDEVQGAVLVLSDGRDTSGDSVNATLKAAKASGARVDVVSLDQSGATLETLTSIADAGGGDVTNADDPAALEALFEEQAQVLSSQLLVSFDVPSDWEGGDATLDIAVNAGDETYTDSAFVALPAAVVDKGPSTNTTPLPVDEPRFVVTKPMMIGGLVATGLGIALLIALMTGGFTKERKATVTTRLAPYGLSAGDGTTSNLGDSPGVVAKAVDATDRAISGGSLDVRVAKKLDAAAMGINAAEWLLLHAAIIVGAGFVGYLLTGSPVLTIALLLVGAVVPWFYLSRKASKRIKSFNAQLADTLQLVSGSLSAGLSLTQSLDTVVREGNEPVSGEFRRALVEQRLGVEVELALEGVAARMHSDDFAWVVMAVRIQREVGGNLAELLLTVAATLREREYLRRQVKTLSAEGRMSAYVLGGLPPAFFGYLMLVQPTYLEPMLTSTLGWMMLGAACVMMAMGLFVMSKMVKVEV